MTKGSIFGFKRPEDSPGFRLWQQMVVWQRLVKKVLSPYGVAHADFVIMAVTLWFEEQGTVPTQIAISNLSKLDKMTVSKALKKLVTQGYVERQEEESDTRAKCVYLTAEGKKLLLILIPLVEKVDLDFFSAG